MPCISSLTLGLALVSLSLCSCTTAHQARQGKASHSTVASAPEEEIRSITPADVENSVVESVNYALPVMPPNMQREIQQAQYTDDPFQIDHSQAAPAFANHADPHSPVQTVGFQEVEEADPNLRTEFTPAKPRQPVDPKTGDVLAGLSERHADEYLFDGGDRDLPVHYDDVQRLGFDTEDTVAEYVDDEGEYHVKPSNRVAVYSPRFGAVRTIDGPGLETTVDRLAEADRRIASVGVKAKVSPIDHVQQESGEGLDAGSRPSGLDSETVDVTVKQRLSTAANSKLQNVFEEMAFTRQGEFLQSNEARLAYAAEAAAVWTRDANPVIVASASGAGEIQAEFRVQEIIGIESKKSKGKLHIIKLADRREALPGEIVTFTIRYDNYGDRDLTAVRIIDNLTPRLAYVEDSATSDLPGQLIIEDNGEGSVILEFELSEALPGHTGGVIQFQARVR